MVGTRLGKFGAILVASLLISACGADRGGQQEKIAVVQWEQASAAHPQYSKLEQGEKILKELQNKRQEQERLAQAQMSSVDKLRGLRQMSQESYLNADFNTHMAELQERENDKLQRYAAAVEAEADKELGPKTKAVEDAYQLKIFNLRALLASVKLKPDERQALEAQLQQAQHERGDRVAALHREKAAYVQAKMEPYMAEAKARMEQAARQYQAQMRGQMQASDSRDKELLAEAPKALSNALSIMDKEIDKQREKNDSLRGQIDRDITSQVTKLAHERGYTIVFNKVAVNVQADDITDAVAQELKKNY